MSDPVFRPRGRRAEPIYNLARRDARTAHRVFRGADGFEVAFPERLLARAITIGESHAPLEWIGQLVGSRYRDEQGRHVVIEAIVQDLDARREPHFVTSTHASEARVRVLAREQYPDAVVVGWIHGHVRHGVRYSRQDFANQATWTDPDSIGIVVDPWSPERVAVYRGPVGELLVPADEAPAERHDLAPPRATLSSEAPPTLPKIAGPRVRRRRNYGRSSLPELAAFTVGVWMGWTDVRLNAFAPRRAAASYMPAPATAPQTDHIEREPVTCDRGLYASEYIEGAAAMQCRAPMPSQSTRNKGADARMGESDTPR